MRINVVHNVFVVLFFLIILALGFMQIIKGDDYHDQSVSNRIRVVATSSPRGVIFDRNGIVLADNRLSFNVTVLPQDVEDAPELFAFLGKVLNRDPKELKKLYLRRKITPFEPVTIAEDIDRKLLISIAENAFSYPGLEISPYYERYYPFGHVGSHVLGYIGKVDPIEANVYSEYGYTLQTIVGKSGIEKAYESYLQGAAGGKQIEVNSRGRQVRILSMKEAVRGQDIQISVDSRLQGKASELLKGQKGSIVLMDLTTGEILSLANAPDYDPNAFSSRDMRAKISDYMNNKDAPLLNRAVSGQFPPGSVFKIPVALAALERGKIETGTSFDCPGYYMLGKAKFGCAHVHGREDLYQAIAHSCNVYFFRIGQLLGPAHMVAYAKAFGLGRKTGIDLPFETQGKLVLPHEKREGWFTGNTLNLSIGQGDTLTSPLQITLMMSAVANNGVLLRPRLIKAIDGKLIPPADFSRATKIILKDSVWEAVKKGMRLVVDMPDGTGHSLSEFKNVDIWAKTGTAQAGRGQPNHAWFAGFMRSSKNNLAFCVFIEHGVTSANAVALTKDLIQYMQDIGMI